MLMGKVEISPPHSGDSLTFTKKVNTVAVQEVDSGATSVANYSPVFVEKLQKSGISGKVLYPARANENADAILQLQTAVAADGHKGSAFFKSFLTGLTLFIIEPFVWYHADYDVNGSVEVVRQGKPNVTVQSHARGRASVKWLSQGKLQGLEGQALEGAAAAMIADLLEKTDAALSE